MITKENFGFLCDVYGTESIREALEAAGNEQWWADFKYACACGWTFETSESTGGGRAFTAHREVPLGWFNSVSDTMINVMFATSAEDYSHPERMKLRVGGWKCTTTKYGAAYLSKGDVVRPLFPSIEAAWADLVRSIP